MAPFRGLIGCGERLKAVVLLAQCILVGVPCLLRSQFRVVEFEPGIGPTWSSSGQFGAQASFEFMIWPWQERKFGWFVDPSYSYSFSRGNQQSLGLIVGLLIGIP